MPKKIPNELVVTTVAKFRRKRRKGIIRLWMELEIYQVDEHRRDDCKNYDRCLDYACVHKWVSFSCAACNGYSGLPKVESKQVNESILELLLDEDEDEDEDDII